MTPSPIRTNRAIFVRMLICKFRRNSIGKAAQIKSLTMERSTVVSRLRAMGGDWRNNLLAQ